MRPSIGAGLIVKNEEKNLKRVIDSLKDCVDEIYITDTGSTDGTVEIAKSLGCMVSHFKWINDFSAARNFNDSQIKTDFSLFIDADDILENQKEFIHFRDYVMNTGDMFVVNYQYASYPDGSPSCMFIRERVFRMSKGIPWIYPIHEGKVAKPEHGLVRMQYIPTWYIRHMRTEDDLKNDRSRNLNILKNLPESEIDARLKYYYGKELFENGNPLDSVRWFEDALKDKDLQSHDRVLALQYNAMALAICNQFDRAIDMAFAGIKIMPNRAEFYNLVGDCFLKKNQVIESKPFFEAARHCERQNGPSPIFTSREAYDAYPSNQIARIYAQTGQFQKCIELLEEVDRKSPNNETVTLLKEVKKIEEKTVQFKEAKYKNEIVFSCIEQGCPHLFDPNEQKKGFTGGSETALIEMAKAFDDLGFSVKVFNRRDSIQEFGNVTYIPSNQLQSYLGHTKPRLHIAWRHNLKLTNAPTYVWSHDLITPGCDVKFYEKVLCLTPFHKEFFHTMTGVPLDWIDVTRNGLDESKYQFKEKVKKNELKFVYTSSPDRGLDRSIRVLDYLREWTKKDLELHVFYGLDKLHPEFHKDLKITLEKMMSERPWVKYHGGVSESVLIDHLRESVMLAAPSDWIETSKITALQMLACGVFPVERRIGGVVDTLKPYEEKGMCAFYEGECTREEEIREFAEICHEHYRLKSWEKIYFDPGSHSWKLIAKEWIDKYLPAE